MHDLTTHDGEDLVEGVAVVLAEVRGAGGTISAAEKKADGLAD